MEKTSKGLIRFYLSSSLSIRSITGEFVHLIHTISAQQRSVYSACSLSSFFFVLPVYIQSIHDVTQSYKSTHLTMITVIVSCACLFHHVSTDVLFSVGLKDPMTMLSPVQQLHLLCRRNIPLSVTFCIIFIWMGVPRGVQTQCYCPPLPPEQPMSTEGLECRTQSKCFTVLTMTAGERSLQTQFLTHDTVRGLKEDRKAGSGTKNTHKAETRGNH